MKRERQRESEKKKEEKDVLKKRRIAFKFSHLLKNRCNLGVRITFVPESEKKYPLVDLPSTENTREMRTNHHLAEALRCKGKHLKMK